MISCAIRERVRRSASASSRILPAGASTALTTRARSTGCGQAGASDSFPASLDRVKGVRLRGTLDASPDGVPDAGPLPCVEVARTGSPVEAELAGAAFQQVCSHDRSEPLPVPPREKCLVTTAVLFANKRLGP